MRNNSALDTISRPPQLFVDLLLQSKRLKKLKLSLIWLPSRVLRQAHQLAPPVGVEVTPPAVVVGLSAFSMVSP